MATKIIQGEWLTGETGLTIDVFPLAGGDALNATPLAFTEDDDVPFLFSASMTEAAAGVGLRVVLYQSASPIAQFAVDLEEVAGYYQMCSGPTRGQIAAEINLNPNVYIVVPAAIANAATDTERITAKRGDTLTRTIVMGDLTGWSKLIFTAKRKPSSQADSAAILQVVLNAVSGTDGLTYLNGAAAVVHTTASLTVTDEDTGSVDLEIDAAIMAQLTVETISWDLEVIFSNGVVSTPRGGSFDTVIDVTIATS